MLLENKYIISESASIDGFNPCCVIIQNNLDLIEEGYMRYEDLRIKVDLDVDGNIDVCFHSITDPSCLQVRCIWMALIMTGQYMFISTLVITFIMLLCIWLSSLFSYLSLIVQREAKNNWINIMHAA